MTVHVDQQLQRRFGVIMSFRESPEPSLKTRDGGLTPASRKKALTTSIPAVSLVRSVTTAVAGGGTTLPRVRKMSSV